MRKNESYCIISTDVTVAQHVTNLSFRFLFSFCVRFLPLSFHDTSFELLLSAEEAVSPEFSLLVYPVKWTQNHETVVGFQHGVESKLTYVSH